MAVDLNPTNNKCDDNQEVTSLSSLTSTFFYIKRKHGKVKLTL